jgi:hypothetical protein
MSVPEHEDPLLEELDEARRRIFERVQESDLRITEDLIS